MEAISMSDKHLQPRAESVDSVPARPATMQPDRRERTSESGKPAKAMFGGLINPWTDDETALARRMFAEGKPDSEFRRLLGRSKFSARTRLYRLHFPTDGYDWLDLPREKRFDVPPEAWAEASRRFSAPRTLTAWICGDPAPGFSALDQRMGGHAYVG
jgi:hypothetical protein